jgi:hypothetical protein
MARTTLKPVVWRLQVCGAARPRFAAIRSATQPFCVAVLEVVSLTARIVPLRVSLRAQSRRYFSER